MHTSTKQLVQCNISFYGFTVHNRHDSSHWSGLLIPRSSIQRYNRDTGKISALRRIEVAVPQLQLEDITNWLILSAPIPPVSPSHLTHLAWFPGKINNFSFILFDTRNERCVVSLNEANILSLFQQFSRQSFGGVVSDAMLRNRHNYHTQKKAMIRSRLASRLWQIKGMTTW